MATTIMSQPHTPTIRGLIPRFKTIRLPIGAKKADELHERLVKEHIEAEGFVDFGRTLTKKERAEWTATGRVAALQPGQYIAQPLSAHSPPDFIVADHYGQRAIEAKSTAELRPFLNQSTKLKTIYVVTTSKNFECQTVVLLGSDIMSEPMLDRKKEFSAKADALLEEYRDLDLNDPTNNFGTINYLRRQQSYVGGNAITSFFEPRVKVFEDRLLEVLASDEVRDIAA